MLAVPFYRIVCDVVVLALVWIPIPMFFFFVKPYQRGFFCDDASIHYPYRHSTITSAVLYSVGSILPTITVIAVEAYRTFVFEPRAFYNGKKLKPRYALGGRTVHPYLTSLYIYLGYFFFGMALNFLITDITKYTVGRLRPHFIDICQPDWSLINCSCTGDNPAIDCKFGRVPYIVDPHCKETNPTKLKHGRVSFPSGHSSFSAYTMIFLVLYLQCRMIWPVGGLLTKNLFQFIAMTLTIATSLSRISDHKHHWSDVFAGFALGLVMAFITTYCFIGFGRRPQNTFARPAPFETRNYSGAQLFDDARDEAKVSVSSMVIEKNETV